MMNGARSTIWMKGFVLIAAACVTYAAKVGVEWIAGEELTAGGTRALLITAGGAFGASLVLWCQTLASFRRVGKAPATRRRNLRARVLNWLDERIARVVDLD